MAEQPYGSNAVYYIIVPGDTLLFSMATSCIPQEGDLVDYKVGAVTTRYRVQDVVHEITDPSPGVQSTGVRERIKVEIQAV